MTAGSVNNPSGGNQSEAVLATRNAVSMALNMPSFGSLSALCSGSSEMPILLPYNKHLLTLFLVAIKTNDQNNNVIGFHLLIADIFLSKFKGLMCLIANFLLLIMKERLFNLNF